MAIETTKAVDETKAEGPRDGAPESMKSVVVFVGSSHPKGATWTAATRFLDELNSLGGGRGEIVLLGKHRIGLCLGCKACFTRGEEHCPLKDDRDALLAKMDAADGVVFAAPNYSFQVSATMKAFLDRLGFVFHRPRFHGKAFTSIVPQGFHGGGKVRKYLDFVGFGLGFNVVKGAYFTALYPIVGEEEVKMNKTVAALGRRFHERLLKPAYPTPSLMQLFMFRGGRISAKLLAGPENRDHAYYRDRGWFDSDFFYPTKLGPVKKAAGALIDRYAARGAKKRTAKTA